jgi:TatD DNase family protein
LYINLHSHHAPAGEEWVLQSKYRQYDEVRLPGYYSIGLHPWYIDENNWKEQFELLKRYSIEPSVLAIGECGLDRITATDFVVQQKVFAAQIQWANEIGKPLIIHCVRAYDEVMTVLHKEGNKVPVIFHGYSKNASLAKKITDKGYYLSFGKAIENETVKEVVRSISINRFFLETDDATISIEEIYKQAAAALQIPVDSLSLQLQQNWNTVFSTPIL